MASFDKGGGARTSFGKNEFLRSTQDVKTDSVSMAKSGIPAETIDGYTDQKVLQPGTLIAKITSGPDSGKYGVFDFGATDGRQTAANLVGIDQTFLPWQLHGAGRGDRRRVRGHGRPGLVLRVRGGRPHRPDQRHPRCSRCRTCRQGQHPVPLGATDHAPVPRTGSSDPQGSGFRHHPRAGFRPPATSASRCWLRSRRWRPTMSSSTTPRV